MKLSTTLSICAAALLAACAPKQPSEDLGWAKNGIETASAQLRAAAVEFADSARMPRSIKNGVFKMIDPYDWTSGFFPGNLWEIYELTGDEFFLPQATAYTDRLYEVRNYKGTHDLGFMMYCSYGNRLRLTGDTICNRVLVDAAESLISRFDPAIGQIRSWDFGEWNYPVIIDNMMNLEMLFWASAHTGDPKYKDIAVIHADGTMKNHYRPDYSCYHVVSYNNDGTVQSQGTFQGFADDSRWARGQAWGLYGFTLCYRFTKDERYLDQARHIAAMIMTYPTMPADHIPYWDYNAPDIPNAPRDVSAAAVTASALLELSGYGGEKGKEYFDYAEGVLRTLSSPEYLAAVGTNGNFVLMHSVGHLPASSEIDVPLNYADYYYLEGLKRYLEIKKADPRTL